MAPLPSTGRPCVLSRTLPRRTSTSQMRSTPSRTFPVRLRNTMRLCDLAQALRGRNDLDGAIAEFRETVRLRPDDIDVRRSLQQALDDKQEATAATSDREPRPRVLQRLDKT